MESLRKLLAGLSLRDRIVIVMVLACAAGSIYLLLHWKKETDFRPLFTQMSGPDAAAVVQKLREKGIEYRLGDGSGSVLIPSARLAETRLEMASAGLPKTGRIGFELFDKTNLGATEFAEQVNFRRALEGELERSVMSLAAVEHARIHLTFPKDSVFLEARQPAKASVMVRIRPGAELSPGNVAGVCNLVASAVEGLVPESVAIVDMQGNLLNRPRRASADSANEPGSETVEFRKAMERELVAKIGSTLEPLLGQQRFRAGVSLDYDVTSGEQSEESFDPDKSVMTTSQKTEDITGPGALPAGGQPGTASNLPRPAARTSSYANGLSRRTENVAYQTSRIVKRVRIPQGVLKRMSIAVLVDQTVKWEGAGASRRMVVSPPAPETLKTIRDLVAGVAGFDANRGDQLIVETLPFESTLRQTPPEVTPTAPARPVNRPVAQQLGVGIAIGAAALLALGAGFYFAWKRQRRVRPKPPETATALASGAELPPLGEEGPDRVALSSPRALELEAAGPRPADLLAGVIRESVRRDAAIPAGVLEAWIAQSENATVPR